MVEQDMGRVWRILLPFCGILVLLAILLVGQGQFWALWGLALAPLALLVLLGATMRRWAIRSRDQLPEYIVSRTVHSLVHEWNQAEHVLRTLRKQPGWTLPDPAGFLAAASRLEPYVGRVRTSGFWEVRRRNFANLPLEILQDASRESRAALRAQLLALSAQHLRRAAAHVQQLDGLRHRGLFDVAPAPFGKVTSWDELLAQVTQIETERTAAVEEALRTLSASGAGRDPGVATVYANARSAQERGDTTSAIESLLRLRPVASARPPSARGAI